MNLNFSVVYGDGLYKIAWSQDGISENQARMFELTWEFGNIIADIEVINAQFKQYVQCL